MPAVPFSATYVMYGWEGNHYMRNFFHEVDAESPGPKGGLIHNPELRVEAFF